MVIFERADGVICLWEPSAADVFVDKAPARVVSFGASLWVMYVEYQDFKILAERFIIAS